MSPAESRDYFAPGRLWSLWEMLHVYLSDLYHCIGRAEIHRNRLERRYANENIGELRAKAQEILEDLKKHTTNYGLENSADFIERTPIHDFHDIDRMATILLHVVKTIEIEGGKRFCFLVDKHKSDLVQNEVPRWVKIREKFPSIVSESSSAVLCYAVGENTACVFHLMRIAEIGLRSLAKERRVRIPKKPVEWADWQEILTFLGKEVEKIGKRRRGPTKDKALAFYQGCLGEFGAFKDTYRNIVMHVRKTYDEHEAASALLHVREFMERLSSKLSENDTKAITWGRF